MNYFSRLDKSTKVNYPGDSNIDITYYKLNLTISHQPNYLKGIVTVQGKSKTGNLTRVFLDLRDNLLVDSIKSNGKKMPFEHTGDQIFISLPQSLTLNESFNFDIYYQGRPDQSGFGSFVFDAINVTDNYAGDSVIWTLSEPYGASNWWPCKDTPADKADSSDVWVRCPDHYTVVSNGLMPEEPVIHGDGTKTTKWKNSYPIAHYLISLAIADYILFEQTYTNSENQSIPIQHYYFPQTAGTLQIQASETLKMLKVFSGMFGEYPFMNEKYGHAQIGFGGGMEHQTISSMRQGNYWGTTLISHELAHQWFGDKLTCGNWENIWLNEGFASYAEGLYLEAAREKQEFLDFLDSEMAIARRAQGSIYVEDISKISEIFDPLRSYAKGGMVLHMLRGIVKDSLFFKILQSYAADPKYAYNVVTTENFQEIAESVSGMELDYFFDEWIYGKNYPDYSYSWGFTQNEDEYVVEINLKQKRNSDPLFFTMPLEILINTESGDTLFTVFNDSQDQNFKLSTKNKPLSLSIDPDNWILKDVKEINFWGELDSGLFSYELKQNYPNPFNSTTNIIYGVAAKEHVVLKVFDILGNEIVTLVNEQKFPGHYIIEFNTENLINKPASGVYIYHLEAGEFTDSKKMLLLR